MTSLRSKLIASHVVVILLAMALVLIISAGFVRRYEIDLEQRRLQQLAVPLSLAAEIVARDASSNQSADPNRFRVLDAQAARLDVTLLVFDANGTVLYDTDPDADLVGTNPEPFQDPVKAFVAAQDEHNQPAVPRVIQTGAGGAFGDATVLLASPGRFRGDYVVAIVSTTKRYPLFRDFLPRILLVTGIALAVASLAGYLLSRRISAPVHDLTEAANAMMTGALHQRVETNQDGEIGTLVTVFNAMSENVAKSSASQRSLLENVAHELRTPLTSIQGYAQALQTGVIATQEEQRQAFATIKMESDRMTALISNLLDLARLESGQLQLDAECISIADSFEDCRKRFAPIAVEAGVELSFHAGDARQLRGNRALVLQALTNLVANAIQHCSQGDTVSMSVYEVGQTIQLIVKDTGEGISPEDLPYIFERFRRGKNGTTGLGLAITREIVLIHGGEIFLDSEPGRGTTVRLTLPAC